MTRIAAPAGTYFLVPDLDPDKEVVLERHVVVAFDCSGSPAMPMLLLKPSFTGRACAVLHSDGSITMPGESVTFCGKDALDGYLIAAKQMIEADSNRDISKNPEARTPPIETLQGEDPAADARAYGEASGGRARRTKEEIADDEALKKRADEKEVSTKRLNAWFKEGIGRRAVMERIETWDGRAYGAPREEIAEDLPEAEAAAPSWTGGSADFDDLL